MSALLPNFFKVNKPRRFNYTPRYYNAEKERLEKLKQKYAQSQDKSEYSNEDLAEMKVRISEEFSAMRPTRKTDKLLKGKKLYIYLAVALIVLYFIFR